MKEVNESVERDAVQKGKVESLENVPIKYNVSKESGPDAVKDCDVLKLSGVDVVEESYTMEYRPS